MQLQCRGFESARVRRCDSPRLADLRLRRSFRDSRLRDDGLLLGGALQGRGLEGYMHLPWAPAGVVVVRLLLLAVRLLLIVATALYAAGSHALRAARLSG